MPPYFDFGKPDMSFVPVWVCLPNFSLKCWSPACLSKISSVIGKPIRCDDLTLSMSRVPFARVMIEVNLFADLLHSINLSMLNGTIIKQRIMYEYKPRFYSICCMLGHTSNVCQKLNFGTEDTSVPGMIKRASTSPFRSSAEDTGHPSGDSCPNPIGAIFESREAIQGGKGPSYILSTIYHPSMNIMILVTLNKLLQCTLSSIGRLLRNVTLLAGSFLLSRQHTMLRVVMLSHSLTILLGLTQLEMANLRLFLLLSAII